MLPLYNLAGGTNANLAIRFQAPSSIQANYKTRTNPAGYYEPVRPSTYETLFDIPWLL